MSLADGEDDGFADLAADGIAKGVFEEGLAEEFVGGVGEEAFLEFALFVGLFLVLAFSIGELDDEAFFGEELGGDFGAGVDDGGVDEETVFDAI